MSQNLPAVPSQRPTPSRTLAPVPPLSNTATATPDPTESALTAVATPRLRAITPQSTHHTIPTTVRHAGTMPAAALALRHQALPHLGLTPTSPDPMTTPTAPPKSLAAAPGSAPASPTTAPTASPAASTSASPEPPATAAEVSPLASDARAAIPDLGSDHGAAAEPTAPSRRALVAVPGPDDGAASTTEPTNARTRVATAGPGLPDPRAWGGRLAQAVSEVLAGDRPISQLVRFTDEAVFADLNRRVRLLGLTTTATARGAKERSSIRSVRVCTPTDEVAEVAAHVRHGDRSRAIALRLEIRRNRWVCTALELG